MSQDYVIEVPGQYPKRCVFRLFGEGGQARHSPAEGGEGSESRKILRALAGQVKGDE